MLLILPSVLLWTISLKESKPLLPASPNVLRLASIVLATISSSIPHTHGLRSTSAMMASQRQASRLPVQPAVRVLTLATGSESKQRLSILTASSVPPTADVDYYALSNTIIIPAGADSAFSPVIPKDDDLTEGPETVVASFLMVPAPLYREDPFHWSAVVVIDDDEFPGPPTVTVAATDCFAVEPPTSRPLDTATFRVSRSGPSNSALEITYTLEGTAENGVDRSEERRVGKE